MDRGEAVRGLLKSGVELVSGVETSGVRRRGEKEKFREEREVDWVRRADALRRQVRHIIFVVG